MIKKKKKKKKKNIEAIRIIARRVHVTYMTDVDGCDIVENFFNKALDGTVYPLPPRYQKLKKSARTRAFACAQNICPPSRFSYTFSKIPSLFHQLLSRARTQLSFVILSSLSHSRSQSISMHVRVSSVCGVHQRADITKKRK